jgi:hypothetical protein
MSRFKYDEGMSAQRGIILWFCVKYNVLHPFGCVLARIFELRLGDGWPYWVCLGMIGRIPTYNNANEEH